MIHDNKVGKKQVVSDGIERFNRVKPTTNVFITLLFVILALICILPAIFVAILSISSEASIQSKGYSFFPNEWTFATYSYLWTNINMIGRSLLNSLFITIVGTFLGLILCSTMGYTLSRPNFKLRTFLTIYIFIPMLFSGGMVATYMVYASLYNLKNTYTVLILPIAVSTFYIIIMRTFFQTTVPDSVIESAKMDGARQIRIFLQIVLPISLPAIATIGLFLTFGYWNDWFLAKMYINTNRQDLYPLQFLLISIENNIEFMTRNMQYLTPGERLMVPSETIRMAIVVIVVLPIACSYPFFQKYFISGLTIGAVKG